MNTSNSESVTAPGNPGERLRQAREARHWSRAEVALQLHLSDDAVRYIEDGLFDKLPGDTFSRGYIRSYAKLLDLDGNQMAQEFDRFIGAQPAAAPLQPLKGVREPTRVSPSVLRGGLFVLSLVAIGIGVLWWQERYGAEPARTSAPIERVEVDTADGSTEVLNLDEPEDQAVQAAQVPLDLMEPLPAEGAAETPAQESAVAEAAAPVEAAPELAPGQGRVQINFIADCWVQVTDATGRVHVAELKREGDSIDLTAPAPLQVRLGFVQGAQVSYNGEPVDLSGRRTQTANLRLGE
ncbi:MAG TPA: RodZ domain-containing protein [Pseudomonas sp.]|nr:RodZ domain-containing protein [Pseudomonas sp.]